MILEKLMTFIIGICLGYIIMSLFKKYILFILSYIKIGIYIIFAAICWLFVFGLVPIYVKFKLGKDPKGSFRYIKFNKL
jgi:hypothetical protein